MTLITAPRHGPTRRVLLACGVLGAVPARAAARVILTVATGPGLDIGAKAAIPPWQQRHPDVDIRILSREDGDHHTAATTALSTSGLLPDVIAVARGNGLQDLTREPNRIDRLRSRPEPRTCARGLEWGGSSTWAQTRDPTAVLVGG